MSIREIPDKIKATLLNDSVFFIVCLLLVGAGSFGLGRLTAPTEPPLIQKYTPHTSSRVGNTVFEPSSSTSVAVKEVSIAGPIEGGYVASKRGDKYHLPWCSGARRISEENKIWFSDKKSAERAGYAPAANCPGI